MEVALYVNDEEGLEAVIHYVREAQDHADQPQPDEREGASRDAVNRPRETLGDSHLISADPRSRFGLVSTFFVARVIASMPARPCEHLHSRMRAICPFDSFSGPCLGKAGNQARNEAF